MKIFITKFATFKTSAENPSEMPKLPYLDSLFKRRLSQVSRMTIEAVHGLIDGQPDEAEVRNLKMVFTSFRGEISRQLKINRGLVEDADVMPANFSISVFNTPPALATIAFKMKAGYTAIYPAEDDFASALVSASASLLCGADKKIIFVYADEYVPEEYKNCPGYTDKAALAFACILSSEKTDEAVEISLDEPELSKIALSPESFLTYLETAGTVHVGQ